MGFSPSPPYVSQLNQAVTDLDSQFTSLVGLAKLQAVATKAAALHKPLAIYGDYVISTWTLPLGIPRLTAYGTLTQAAAGAKLVDVSLTRGLRIFLAHAEGATPGVSGGGNDSAIWGDGDGTNLGSGPNDLVVEAGTYCHGFGYHPILLRGAERVVIETGVRLDGNFGGVRLTGCSGVVGRITVSDYGLIVPSNVLITGLQLESTDGNTYPTCHDIDFQWPLVDSMPGCEAILCHAGERVNIKARVRNCAEGVIMSSFNDTDLVSGVNIEADVTLIAPYSVTAATWLAGVATITLGPALTESGTTLAFAVGQHVTLAGFTPAGWNGSFVVASVVGAVVTLTMPVDPTAMTILGTAAYTINTPGGAQIPVQVSGTPATHARNCSVVGGKYRNGNSIPQHDNWGGGHFGYIDGFVEADNEFSYCWGTGPNIINVISEMNIGKGTVVKKVQTTPGGASSGYQFLAIADGSTGLMGQYLVDSAKYIATFLGAQNALPNLFHSVAAGTNLTGATQYNGYQRCTFVGSPSANTSVLFLNGIRFFQGVGSPVDATIIAATGVSPGNGDFYFRTDGSPSAGVYIRTGAAWHTLSDSGLVLNNGQNVVTGTGAGASFGGATNQPVGFHGVAVAQRAGAAQAAVAATGSTQASPFGYTTAAQADAIVTLLNEMRAALVGKGIMKGSA